MDQEGLIRVLTWSWLLSSGRKGRSQNFGHFYLEIGVIGFYWLDRIRLRAFKSCAAFGTARSTKVARCLYCALKTDCAPSLRVARCSHFAQNFGHENFYAKIVRIWVNPRKVYRGHQSCARLIFCALWTPYLFPGHSVRTHSTTLTVLLERCAYTAHSECARSRYL